MNIKVVDKKDIIRRAHHHKVQSVVEEFIRMDAEAIMIDSKDEGYTSTRHAQTSFISAIRKLGYSGRITTRVIDTKLYLMKV